jgi:hypothetical protein
MTRLYDYQLEEMFDEMLDECYPVVRFGELYYSASDVLRSTDPTAHRCGFNDWLDSQLSDGILFEHSDGTIHDEEEETQE